MNIESKNNDRIKDLIRLRDDSKFRNDKSLFYVEGERILRDTPQNLVNEMYVKKSKYDVYKDLLGKYDASNIYILNDEVYDKVTDTVNSQGIIATVRYNILNELNDDFLNNIKSCIILDSVSDPGNLGTILRVSEAAKVDLIVLSSGCCNIYNTKVIRASMSSIFRINIYVAIDLIDIIKILENKGFDIYVTALDSSATKFMDANFKNKHAIVFGNEASGVSDEVLKTISNHIYIPMKGSIESLNVSTSVSIVLYEVMRQNNYYEN